MLRLVLRQTDFINNHEMNDHSLFIEIETFKLFVNGTSFQGLADFLTFCVHCI